MSKMVEPFMFGSHLHYADMPACLTCEQENAQWDKLVERTHTYELATKLTRTKAYRAYRQAKPFDDKETVLSLDMLMEEGIVMADDHSEDMLDMVARAEELEQFQRVLSPKQKHVMDMLLAGMESRDIYRSEGYKSTGGVRYHKHVIRKKYKDFRS